MICIWIGAAGAAPVEADADAVGAAAVAIGGAAASVGVPQSGVSITPPIRNGDDHFRSFIPFRQVLILFL
jgi:hypothetical protein